MAEVLVWIAAEPRRMMILLVGSQLLLWTTIPFAFHTSLPLDVVKEGLINGHEWQWGYAKHPPLTYWLIELSFDFLGDLGPFLLSQLTIVATYWFVFLLGRELMDERWAAAGTLLLTGSYFFSFPTPEFNQNVVQMAFWAGATYAFCKALQTGSPRWWIILGAAVGLGALTKYTIAENSSNPRGLIARLQQSLRTNGGLRLVAA